MTYPYLRPRRMRRDEFSRRLMRESVLTADDLVYPVFVHEAPGRAAVPSMPGVERLSLAELPRVAEPARQLQLPAPPLFPTPAPAAQSPVALPPRAHDRPPPAATPPSHTQLPPP